MSAPLLSVPRRNDKLADIEKRPRKIRKWLNQINAASEDSARQILQVQYAQNRIDMSVTQRLQNLEVFDKALSRISVTLFRPLKRTSIPFTDDERDSLSLLQRIHTELAYGYKIVLLETSRDKGDRAKKIGLIAAVRAMKCLVNNLFYRHHSFAPESPAIWRDINGIFQIADSQSGVQGAALNLLTVLRHEYETALLLHLSLPGGLTPAQVTDMFELLRRWPLNHPKIQWLTGQAEDAQNSGMHFDPFMLSLNSSAGPVRLWSDFTAKANKTIRFFNAQPTLIALHQLVDSLKKDQSVPLLDELSGNSQETRHLLETLITCWGKPSVRKDDRRESSGSVFLCAGLSCLHGILSKNSAGYGKQSELNYPNLSRWQFVNQSAGGMCIAHNKTLPHSLQPGDIVGLMTPESKEWRVGTVRWMKNGRRYEIGIQTFGDTVSPVTLSRRDSSLPTTLFPALMTSQKGYDDQLNDIFFDRPDVCGPDSQLYLHFQDKVTRLREPFVRSTPNFNQITPRKPQVCLRSV